MVKVNAGAGPVHLRGHAWSFVLLEPRMGATTGIIILLAPTVTLGNCVLRDKAQALRNISVM